MANCPKLVPCPFFNDRMANSPASAALMKGKYCQKEFESCARYIVATRKGGGTVPMDLFPNHVERANSLIS